MQIHQLVKNALTEHKQKIELTQWAIISGVTSLFYSEYIRRFRQKEVPVKVIMVPSLKTVSDYLRSDSPFMEHMSETLIDSIANHRLIKQYADAPELVMFKEDNIEIMKTVFDLYIIPNITRRIPETIAKKFGLNDEKQQVFRETFDIRLFDDQHINDDQYKFIIDQIVLQLLMLIPTMKKEVEIPEDHVNMMMSRNEILSIANDSAVCPIHFNADIIKNKSVIDLLSFVTNTTINDISGGDIAPQKRDVIVDYMVTTGLFNQVTFTRLVGIDYQEDNN